MNKLVMAVALSTALCSVSLVAAQTQKRTAAPMQAPVASTTIYKLVDENGRITYSNLPLKGASVVDLDPLTVLPSAPRTISATTTTANVNINAADGSNTLAVQATASVPAVVAPPPMLAMARTSFPNVDAATQKKRDETRRDILEAELKAEEKLLADAVITLSAVESDRTAIGLMRAAGAQLTPAAYAEARRAYEQREEKLQTLQAGVAVHEKNLGALKKELASIK